MTVKTFMTANLYKYNIQRRTGDRTLTYMVIYLKKDKGQKNILILVLLTGGEIDLK